MTELPSNSQQPHRIFNRFTRIFDVGVILASLPTLLAAGARWHWMLDLMTHFRVQFVVSLVPFLLVHLWQRKWWFALLAAVVIAINAAMVLPLFWTNKTSPT